MLSHGWLLKSNAAGDSSWAAVYDSTHHMYSVDRTIDNGYYLAGDFTAGGTTALTILRVDSVGNPRWVVQHQCGMDPGPTNAVIRTMADGGCIAVAGTRDGLYYYTQLIKLDSAGRQVWSGALVGSSSEYPAAILPMADGGFVLASTSSYRMALRRFAPDPNFVVDAEPMLPGTISLTASPNPFNPITTLTITLPRERRARIVIYNTMGREVRTISTATFGASERRIPFDGSALPSGLYFARLESGRFAATQRLMLLK
jgi:hypothetical protein